MGYKSLSQKRVAGESAIASGIGVYASLTSGGGYNISGQSLTSTTSVTQTIVTPGQSSTTSNVGSTNAVIQSVIASNVTYASIGGSIFPTSYIKVFGSGFVPNGYLSLNGTTINGNVYYSANELRANLAATPGLLGSVSNINLLYQLPAITAGTSSILVTPLVVATGGTVYTCGPYKYHVFNTSANLVVTGAGSISVMMVGGGGGGGCSNGSCGGAGGGGAGGVIYAPAVCVTSQPYVINVGAGASRKGANTTAFNMIALGGGAGIPNYGFAPNMGNGGSGGGAAKSDGCIRTYGVSYQNSYAPPGALVYGNNGGATVSNPTAGAGGGGAGAVGGNAAGSGACAGGQGGDGTSTYSTFLLAANSGINVSGTYYIAGGGGGGNGLCIGNGAQRRGGYGGGGAGGAYYNPSSAHSGRGFAGNVNTGGGGGGAARDPSTSYNCGGSGGSGVVIIKYQYQ